MSACRHVIAHWTTETERRRLLDELAYARRIGDLQALPLLLARLTQPCEFREPVAHGAFAFGGYAWDVTAARRAAHGRPVVRLDPRDWFPWLPHLPDTATERAATGDGARETPGPVIVVRIADAAGARMVIDGWPLIAAAHRRRRAAMLPAVVLDETTERRIRLYGGEASGDTGPTTPPN